MPDSIPSFPGRSPISGDDRRAIPNFIANPYEAEITSIRAAAKAEYAALVGAAEAEANAKFPGNGMYRDGARIWLVELRLAEDAFARAQALPEDAPNHPVKASALRQASARLTRARAAFEYAAWQVDYYEKGLRLGIPNAVDNPYAVSITPSAPLTAPLPDSVLRFSERIVLAAPPVPSEISIGWLVFNRKTVAWWFQQIYARHNLQWIVIKNGVRLPTVSAQTNSKSAIVEIVV